MKEIVKKLIPNSIKQAYRKRNYDRTKSAFVDKSAKETFAEIYKTNHWQGKESVSGTGSDEDQVKALIGEINTLIKELEVASILDLPCGDFYWMKSVDLKDINYTGADIVDDLIQNNSKNYASDNIQFKVINLISDPLPKADLIINRDCLVHLSFKDIYGSIKNIKSSGCKYLLTTSFTRHKLNFDICTGDWRTLNLQQEPFNFPDPIKVIDEKCTEGNGEFSDKCLMLFAVKDIHLPSDVYKAE